MKSLNYGYNIMNIDNLYQNNLKSNQIVDKINGNSTSPIFNQNVLKNN